LLKHTCAVIHSIFIKKEYQYKKASYIPYDLPPSPTGNTDLLRRCRYSRYFYRNFSCRYYYCPSAGTEKEYPAALSDYGGYTFTFLNQEDDF